MWFVDKRVHFRHRASAAGLPRLDLCQGPQNLGDLDLAMLARLENRALQPVQHPTLRIGCKARSLPGLSDSGGSRPCKAQKIEPCSLCSTPHCASAAGPARLDLCQGSQNLGEPDVARLARLEN